MNHNDTRMYADFMRSFLFNLCVFRKRFNYNEPEADLGGGAEGARPIPLPSPIFCNQLQADNVSISLATWKS